jgi:2'-hydroxyisoflavone reductase
MAAHCNRAHPVHGISAARAESSSRRNAAPGSQEDRTFPMTTSRREFIRTAAVAAAGLSATPFSLARPAPRGTAKSLLILGGTGFLGPAVQEAAIARGYAVTLFNRGRAEALRRQIERPSNVMQGVEVLYGNRDPNKTADAENDGVKLEKDPNSPKGLSQLEGRKFDAVVDTSGYYPRMVKASADLLAPNVKQYLFISTISVYKDTSTPGADTTAELATTADPTLEDLKGHIETYGPLKALCEQAVGTALPGRATIVRPGYIVGRRDGSRRFTSWPVRASQGGEMIAPGSPDDPIQIIDVRDLAEWCIELIDKGVMDTFDATGPTTGLTWGRTLQACKAASENDTKLTWIPGEFLEKHGVMSAMPIWIPPTGEYAGFHTRNVDKSVKAGLKLRHVNDTCKDALAWYNTLSEKLKPGIVRDFPPERERAVLEAWHKEGLATPPK